MPRFGVSPLVLGGTSDRDREELPVSFDSDLDRLTGMLLDQQEINGRILNWITRDPYQAITRAQASEVSW
jgi:hypothetical protein